MTRVLVLTFILGACVVAVLLNVLMLPFGAAAQEPEPRPSPTPQPWIHLVPAQAVAGEDLLVQVTGICWPYPGFVSLNWERSDGPPLLAVPVAVEPDGGFAVEIRIPAEWATPDSHAILATHSAGYTVAASLAFAAPTPTDTPCPPIPPCRQTPGCRRPRPRPAARPRRRPPRRRP